MKTNKKIFLLSIFIVSIVTMAAAPPPPPAPPPVAPPVAPPRPPKPSLPPGPPPPPPSPDPGPGPGPGPEPPQPPGGGDTPPIPPGGGDAHKQPKKKINLIISPNNGDSLNWEIDGNDKVNTIAGLDIGGPLNIEQPNDELTEDFLNGLFQPLGGPGDPQSPPASTSEDNQQEKKIQFNIVGAKDSGITTEGNPDTKTITIKLTKDFATKDDLNTKFDKSDFTNENIVSKLEKGSVKGNGITVTNGNNRLLGTEDLTLSIADGSISKDKLDNGLKTVVDNIGKGTIDDNPTNANTVTGSTVKNYVESKISNFATNDAVNNKLDKDFGNYDTSNNKSVSTKLSTGANLDKPVGILVTDSMVKEKLDTKFDKSDFTNENIVSKLEKGSVKGNGITVTNGNNRLLGTEDLTLSIADGSISKDKLDNGFVNSLATKDDLNGKANINADNLNTENVAAWKNKLGIKQVDYSGQIAGVNAIAGIPQVAGIKNYAVGLGVGYSGHAYAVALGFSGKSFNDSIIYKLSGSLSSKKTFGISAGLAYAFGGKTPESPVDKSNELKDLKQKYSDLQKENAEIKDMLSKLLSRKTRENVILTDFVTDKYQLKDDMKSVIDSIVDKNAKYEITGYTDMVGQEKYNLELGYNRAKAVAEYLVSKGVKPENIEIFSMGYNKINGNNYNKQRRVVITIIK